jgi:DNA replication protein DnaC
MTERIGSVLESEPRGAMHWCDPPIALVVSQQIAGYEKLSLRELRDLEMQLRFRFSEAAQRSRGDAEAIRSAARPVQVRLRTLQAAADFARVCPIAWMHSATESEALAKVHATTLTKLLADPLVLNRSLLICGPTSAGKSTALGIMVRRTIEGGFTQERDQRKVERSHIQWAYARALAQASRNHPLGQGECEAIANARSAGILVLDDLGLERDQAEIVDVVHDRYEHGRVTWTTTGLTKAELDARYGESFVRRLVEGRSPSGIIVNCFPKVIA